MYCANCGAKAGGNFCSGCGQRLTAPVAAIPDEPQTPPSTTDWKNEVDPTVVLAATEVRAMIDQAAADAEKPFPLDEVFKLYDKLAILPVPSGALMNVVQPLYERVGVKTGKTRTEDLPEPPGRVLAALFVALARKGRKVLDMHRADAGCVVTAELPADLWTMSGKLVVAVERTPTGTRVQAATAIGGQYFDWGKSTRCLDGLFGDLKKSAA